MELRVIDDERVLEKIRAVEPQKRAVEREVLRRVREAQGSKRVSWKREEVPHWWNHGAQILLNKIHESPVTVPPFDAEAKKTWNLLQLQALLALAIRAEVLEAEAEDESSSGHSSIETPQAAQSEQDPAEEGPVPVEPDSEIYSAHNQEQQVERQLRSEEVDHPAGTATPVTEERKRKRVAENIAGLSGQQEQPKPVPSVYMDMQLQQSKRVCLMQRIDNIVEEIDVEIDARCSELRTLSQNAAFSIKNAYRVQMMKLPRKVRSMPLRRFLHEYQGQLSNVLLKDMETSVAAALNKRPRTQVRRKPALSQRPITYTGSYQSTASQQTHIRNDSSKPSRPGGDTSSIRQDDKENWYPNHSPTDPDHHTTEAAIENTVSYASRSGPFHKPGRNQSAKDPVASSAASKVEQLQQLAALQRQVADMISALASN